MGPGWAWERAAPQQACVVTGPGSVKTTARLQVLTTGHSSASSSGPKGTPGGTSLVSLNVRTGADISAGLRDAQVPRELQPLHARQGQSVLRRHEGKTVGNRSSCLPGLGRPSLPGPWQKQTKCQSRKVWSCLGSNPQRPSRDMLPHPTSVRAPASQPPEPTCVLGAGQAAEVSGRGEVWGPLGGPEGCPASVPSPSYSEGGPASSVKTPQR